MHKKCTEKCTGAVLCVTDPETNEVTTTEYFYNGSILAGQKTGNDTIIFMYDNNGDVFGFTYNGTPYYYAKNAQNDVVFIYNEAGLAVAVYQYDAWGKVTACYDASGCNLAKKNPIMYRSYYADLETGLCMYYLNSRYYVADWGRFLSADSVVGVTADILSYNIFTYCFNNPIILIDTDGTCPYNGTAADFHRLEHGLPSLDCTCVDLTEKLTSYMEENTKNLKKYKEENGFIKTTKYFYNNVKDGGALDIKLQDEWQFEEGKKYVFNGKQLRYDDPGNINFGYVGAVIFPEGILCFGAGLNQIGKHGFKFGNLSTWYDDPRDNEMIKYGYQLYEEAHK